MLKYLEGGVLFFLMWLIWIFYFLPLIWSYKTFTCNYILPKLSQYFFIFKIYINSTPKTNHSYSSNDKKLRALRDGTKLKEGYIVRYADDFRIMARDYDTAVKWFHAVRKYLKDRLKLDISPEKSQVINLRKKSSDFLSYKIKAARKKGKVVAFTYVSDKKTANLLQTIKERIHAIKKEPSQKNISNYLNDPKPDKRK